MTNPTSSPPGTGAGTSRSVWLTFTLFFITVLALAVVIYLVVQPSEGEREVVLQIVDPETAPSVNTGAVVDLDANPDAEAVLGGRYRVTIRENSRDGSSGMVRVGGLVTFVNGAAAGDAAVIEITRLQARTAQAVALSVERAGETVAVTPAMRSQPAAGTLGLVGSVHTGTVTRMGSRGDGAVSVEGKTVYVRGATGVGQKVVFRIEREEDTYAVGNLLSLVDAAAAPVSAFAKPDSPRPDDEPRGVKAPHIQVGMTYEVEVTGVDRYNAENGMTRVDDLVVIIPGAKVGDRVRIEISERKDRYALSRVLETLPAPAGE